MTNVYMKYPLLANSTSCHMTKLQCSIGLIDVVGQSHYQNIIFNILCVIGHIWYMSYAYTMIQLPMFESDINDIVNSSV